MKKIISLLATIAVLVSSLSFTTNAATQVYDLKSDWSDTQNPNGTWSYRSGFDKSLLVNVDFAWGTFVDEQGAALGVTKITETSSIPGWLEPGDIIVLTGTYGVVVRWTAPAIGMINVAASAWDGEQEYWVDLPWALTLNGSSLSSGEMASGEAFGQRPSLYDFSAGSGGAAALQNISVQAGDEVELVCFTGGGAGAVGLNFTITLTTGSVDPVSAIENLALTVFAMNLQNGIENSLDSKLDAALHALVDANVNNDGAAFNSLGAFISAVEAQRDNKISSAQADQLIASAQQIQNMLDCAN